MIAVVFPGQGSQAPGMGKVLYDSCLDARATFQEVSAATGIDLAKLCFETDEATLKNTENAQLALYTTGLAAFRAFKPKIRIHAAAGHSVGEYAALAAAGFISVQEGAKLVRQRGLLMAESGRKTPGTMSAVLGLDRNTVDQECSLCEGVCVMANDNCPGQLVISGSIEGVAECSERLTKVGAKRVLPLNVSGAFHSPLMKAASQQMALHLANANFQKSTIQVYSNVTAQPESVWKRLLEKQLQSPVRWTESIQNMVAVGITTFIECGNGNVLSGLIKRIAPDARLLSISDPESLEKTAVALEGVRA